MNRSLDLPARHYVAYLLPVLYVSAGALRETGSSLAALLTLLCLPALIVLALRWTEHIANARTHLAAVGEASVTAFRLQASATGVYVAASLLPTTSSLATTALMLVLPASQVTTLLTLARVPEGPGLLRCPAAARRVDGAIAVALVGAIGASIMLLSLGQATQPTQVLGIAADSLPAFANLFGLFVLVAATLRLRFLRRLELALAERLTLVTLTTIGSTAAALVTYPLGSLANGFSIVAGLAIAFVLLLAGPKQIAQLLQATLALVIVGVPLLAGSAILTSRVAEAPGPIMLVLGAIFLAVGALTGVLGPRLLGPMAPWVEAVRAAQNRVTLADPTTALRAVLTALRDRLDVMAPSPVLFRSESHDAVTVDRAGYLHERPFVLPPDLDDLCHHEPFHTLRLEVARALEVRTPRVRPVLAWMEAHGFGSVTSLQDQETTLGFLIMPRGRRRTPLTFLEVAALDQLAERLTAVVALSAALVAGRQRQRDAEEQTAVQRERAETWQARAEGDAERVQLVVQQAADATRSGRYSPAIRMFEDALVRSCLADRGPLQLHVAPGSNPLPWIAKTHLRGPRQGGPLVVLDATQPYLQGPETTQHIDAAWRLCHHGTLVVTHASTLPAAAQRHVQELVPRSGGPYLIMTLLGLPLDPASEERSSKLREPTDISPLLFPPLAQRPEDIRPLALDFLGRLGLALRGIAFGLEENALAQLLEYPWPANEKELHTVLRRAALATTTGTIRATDVARFLPPPFSSSHAKLRT